MMSELQCLFFTDRQSQCRCVTVFDVTDVKSQRKTLPQAPHTSVPRASTWPVWLPQPLSVTSTPWPSLPPSSQASTTCPPSPKALETAGPAKADSRWAQVLSLRRLSTARLEKEARPFQMMKFVFTETDIFMRRRPEELLLIHVPWARRYPQMVIRDTENQPGVRLEQLWA